jgi:hypothetical protein
MTSSSAPRPSGVPQMPWDRGRVCVYRDESERTCRDRLPPRLERLEFRRFHCVSDEPVRRVAEQDLPRLGDLLESRGDLHCIARREALGGSGHDHARTHTDAGLNSECGRAFRISIADRQARSASSSCAAGMPKTAITASRMNFSTVPPCASTIPFIRSK